MSLTWMLLVGSALAADPTTDQGLVELEWARAEPLPIAALIPGADAETRARAARALGRLRDPDALQVLEGLVDDPEPSVRVAVAEALGTTPGATDLVRARLREVVPPSGLGPRAAAEHGELVALLEALGQQGTARDLGPVLAALREPWPVGAAAARALGTMGTRKVAALGEAVPALVSRLDATDPRLVADASWALSRIGLADATPAMVAVVERRIRGGALPEARAWLIKAAWPALPPESRDEIFLRSATDPSRLVRVAMLTAVRRDEIGGDVVASWLADSDPWIRAATLDALGRIRDDASLEALERWADEGSDPWEAAAALRALAEPQPERAADPTLPEPVRAAAIETLDDRQALIGYATDPDLGPSLRSAAAGVLSELPDAGRPVAEALLGSTDSAVREAGVVIVETLPPRERAAVLLPHLRVEPADDVLAAGLAALTAALAADPKVVAPGDKALAAVLERVGARPQGRVRTLAEQLAARVGASLPAPSAPVERELVLPGGEVVRVDGSRPALAEALRIRGATIETTGGRFQVQLDPETAPLAVANFAALAESGFFDGVVWHRVVPGFVVQTGCPRGDGWGGPGWTIPDEVGQRPFDVGALGMARADRDTGGSQWFVTTSRQPHLVGEYTRFGEVVGGMHVVDHLGVGDRVLSVHIERIAPEDLR